MTAHAAAREPDARAEPFPHADREWASAATTLLADAAGVLRDILALTSPVAHAATTEEGEEALALLERRNPHIDRLARLAPSLERVRHEWQAREGSLPPEIRAAVDAGLRRVGELRAEIARAEDRAAAALASRRDALAAQLAEARSSRAATRAYAAGASGPPETDQTPRYQDTHG